MDRRKPEVTTAIILETRVKNSDGTYPVKLRITYERKRKYYSLKGEHYKLNEFEDIVKPDSRGKNKEKRKKFESVENRAINIIDNVLNEFSFEAFEREYLNHKKGDTSINSYFEDKAQELDRENKIQTATLYRAALRSLLKYDGKITFQKINPNYLEKYQKWMIAEENSYTTVGMYMRNLKHVVNRAIQDRIIHEYPFGDPKKGKYQIPDGKNSKKALRISDIEKLFNYTPSDRNEYLALNYWLFSYLCNGMNMVDIANLKYKNIKGSNIEFIRQKTKDTTKEVPVIKVLLLPEIQQIVDRIGSEDKAPENFIFPVFKTEYTELEKHKRLKQHIKNTNKYIRRIAKSLGINEAITTYWARHSYSTILKRSGAPIEFISEQLGHQSTKVTKHYLDSFEDEQREKYSSVLIPGKNGQIADANGNIS